MVRFVIFGCIWDRLVSLRNSVQNGSNWCKSSCHEVASEVFATNAPDPPNWTLNSTFVAFRSVWVRLGLFCYDSKLSAKWAELVQLMQKFMPRSCIGCFRNERTRSTPLDPKLLFTSVVFGCIWDRSVALRYSVENGTNCCNKCKSSSHI